MTIRIFNGFVPVIHPTAYVDASAVVIGDVNIGRDSSVWPQTVIRGDIHKIVIGEQSNIQDGSVLHVTHAGRFNPEGAALTIGHQVIVGHRVTLHGCTLEGECLIGMGAVIMDNVVVHRHVMVGAGAVVGPGKVLEAGYVWLGNPVRKGRKLTENEIAYLSYSADYYVKLKEQYRIAADL